jgi:hypothetical protein
MVFDTKTWLKATAIKYSKGQPYLLQYILNDEELDTLAKLIDALSDYRVSEALEHYKTQQGNNLSE